MKMIYIILAAVILIGLFIAFSFKKKNEIKGGDNFSTQSSQDTTRPRQTEIDENPYEGLKRLAYSVDYNKLNLPDAQGKEVLYGVLMDWDYEEKAIITLVSFKTGDLSLYFSTGAMILGAGQHDDANLASKAFVQKGEALLPQANSADTSLMIEKGMLKFYLLTTKGKYTIKDKMENVYNHTSPLSKMFEEADKLITLIRRTQEKVKQKSDN